MPVTSVKAPDGSIIKVNHPEGASREDIFEFALQQYQARGGEPDAAPGEIPTAPTEEELGQAPSPTGSGYSVGDALIGLRNAGVPNEAIAAIETLLTLGTGAIGGTAGMAAGALGAGIAAAERGEFGTPEAAQMIQEAAMRGAESLTYSPRTEMAQRMLGQVAEVSEPLAQLPPILPTAGIPGAAAATLPQRARMAQAALPERPGAAPAAPAAVEAPVIDQARQRITGQGPATPSRIVPGAGEAPPAAPGMVDDVVGAVEEVAGEPEDFVEVVDGLLTRLASTTVCTSFGHFVSSAPDSVLRFGDLTLSIQEPCKRELDRGNGPVASGDVGFIVRTVGAAMNTPFRRGFWEF